MNSYPYEPLPQNPPPPGMPEQPRGMKCRPVDYSKKDPSTWLMTKMRINDSESEVFNPNDGQRYVKKGYKIATIVLAVFLCLPIIIVLVVAILSGGLIGGLASLFTKAVKQGEDLVDAAKDSADKAGDIGDELEAEFN